MIEEGLVYLDHHQKQAAVATADVDDASAVAHAAGGFLAGEGLLLGP
jgi:hypothetical protein